MSYPSGHHQGRGHGAGTGRNVRAPRCPRGITQRPCLAVNDLLTSEKEFFQAFSSIGCHFSAKAQAKWACTLILISPPPL